VTGEPANYPIVTVAETVTRAQRRIGGLKIHLSWPFLPSTVL